jgi:hypothetical protein
MWNKHVKRIGRIHTESCAKAAAVQGSGGVGTHFMLVMRSAGKGLIDKGYGALVYWDLRSGAVVRIGFVEFFELVQSKGDVLFDQQHGCFKSGRL